MVINEKKRLAENRLWGTFKKPLDNLKKALDNLKKPFRNFY